MCIYIYIIHIMFVTITTIMIISNPEDSQDLGALLLHTDIAITVHRLLNT